MEILEKTQSRPGETGDSKAVCKIKETLGGKKGLCLPTSGWELHIKRKENPSVLLIITQRK